MWIQQALGAECSGSKEGRIVSEAIRARVSSFARQTIDLHLPLLLGTIAERGGSVEYQADRAARLVEILSTTRLEPQLMRQGRPIPVELRRVESGVELRINQAMLERVDDHALANAMATPVAKVLGLPPSTVSLILNLSDERQIRGMVSQITGEHLVVALTRIERLMRWRLATLEERLSRLVDGTHASGSVSGTEGFLRALGQIEGQWPRFEEVSATPYIGGWVELVRAEMGRTAFGESAEKLVEMLWESLVISPQSALRQAAQTLRGLSLKGDPRRMLSMLARALGEEGMPVDGSLHQWPSFEDILESWELLNAREDALIGARRGVEVAPKISVFTPPGESMGFSEPKNLPWDQPLLCWSMRERSALGDLLKGMAQSLEREMGPRRNGRLDEAAFLEQAEALSGAPRLGRQTLWQVNVPTVMPECALDFPRLMRRGFQVTSKAYREAFGNLGMMEQIQALNLAKGAYTGYLKSSAAVWKRRLVTDPDASPAEAFEVYLNGLARALEWPIFVDVFEEGIEEPKRAKIPAFTLLAVWTEGKDFAPLWLPVEAIGESLAQAPLRVRNIAVRSDGSAIWLGDHHLERSEMRALSTEGLLRGIHDGAILLTIHRT